MFVIGRNAKAEVVNGKLTIECEMKDMIPSVSVSHKRYLLATTNGDTNLPMSELLINLTVYGGKVSIAE